MRKIQQKAGVAVAERAMFEEKSKKTLVQRTVQVKDETEMKTPLEKDEEGDLATSLTKEGRVPRETRILLKRKVQKEREEVLVEEEESVKCVAEDVEDLDHAVVEVEVEVEGALGVRVSLKQETDVIDLQ